MKSNHVRPIYVLVLLAGIAILAGCEGNAEFRKGKQQEADKNLDQAVITFKKALDKKPNDPEYRVAYEQTRLKAGYQHYDKGHRLEQEKKYPEALAEYEQAFTIDPGNDIARDDYNRLKTFMENAGVNKEMPTVLERMKENEVNPARAVELSPVNTTPLTLKITDTAKRIYETISKLAGINVVFDPDYDQSSGNTRLTVEMNNVTLLDALEILAIRTRSFWKPLNSNTILVATDNQQKRKAYEDQIMKTLYLSNSLDATDLTNTVNNLRQLLNLRNIVQFNNLNAIVIRDTPDKVAMVEKIIKSIDKTKPEVIIDVAVLEIDRNRVRDLGITPLTGTTPGLGTSASFNNNLSGGATTTGSSSSSSTGSSSTGTTTATIGTVPINRLSHLTGGSFSVVIPAAQAQAILSDTHAKILQNPQLRASDGKMAKIRIGQKVPISTGSFTPFTGGGATAGNIFSQFQYQDIGVNMDVTPKVHLDREITLDIKVEISSIAGQQNFNGLLEPIFNNRSVEHQITLREGEANVLAGIISDEDRKVVSGVPGLSQIPFLRYLFSNEHTERNQQEFVIVMTPHIVRLPQFDDMNLRGLYVGTDDDLELKNKLPRLGELTPPAPETTPGSAPSTPAAASASPTAGPASTPQPGVGVFRINPASGTFPQDKPFTVTVNVDNLQNVFGVSLALAWDPKVIRLTDALEGGFLGQDQQPIALVQRPDNDAGTVVISLSRPPEVPAISGSGNLVTLTFEPIAKGQTALAFSQLFPRTAAGERIAATSVPGQIVIQ